MRGACVSAIAIGTRGAEGTRKKLRAAALAFPTAAAPLISPKLCGPPTGLQCQALLSYGKYRLKAAKARCARVAFPIAVVKGEREGGLW